MDKFEVISADGKWTVNGKVFYTEAAARTYAEQKTNPQPQGAGASSKVVWQIIIGCALAYAAFSCTSSSKDKAAGISESEALMLCQYAIKGALGNASSVDAPYVDNYGSGDESYFAWGASTKYVRGGSAGNVSASCTVDKLKRKVTSLTVNGQTVL